MSENTTENAPTLTISDVAFLVKIVEVCASRGAFQAEELSNIGSVYDRVRSFVIANTPPEANQPNEATPTEGN